MPDTDSPQNPEVTPGATPHKRRPRYSGKYPRKFEEKYKELAAAENPDTVAKVIASGKTVAGTHRPICVAEILEVLKPAPGLVAVDATLGFGGHAAAILQKLLPGGRLIGLDTDPLELPKTEARLRRMDPLLFGLQGRARSPSEPPPHRSRERQFTHSDFTMEASVLGGKKEVRDLTTTATGSDDGELPLEALSVHHTNYAGMPKVLASLGLTGVDLVLADLGLSSMQIDNPARGFSPKHEGPLDMRLNPAKGEPASALLRRLNAEQLTTLFTENADEPHAFAIAQRVADLGRQGRLLTTRDLATAVRESLARLMLDDVDTSVRRVFQAIRIAVNDEFSALDTFLRNLPGLLNPGGRAAILTFHSGEDRRVKKSFEAGLASGLYIDIAQEVIRPSREEVHDNPRASSAKLRWTRKG